MGIFLPNERFGNGPRSGELWTQSRLMTCLLTYYRHTREKRVLTALEKLCDLVVRQYGPLAQGRSLYRVPDEDGSKTHSLMIIEPILSLYHQLKKPEYLAFCEFLYEDYSLYAADAKFPCYDLARDKASTPRRPSWAMEPTPASSCASPCCSTGKPAKRTITPFSSAPLTR